MKRGCASQQSHSNFHQVIMWAGQPTGPGLYKQVSWTRHGRQAVGSTPPVTAAAPALTSLDSRLRTRETKSFLPTFIFIMFYHSDRRASSDKSRIGNSVMKHIAYLRTFQVSKCLLLKCCHPSKYLQDFYIKEPSNGMSKSQLCRYVWFSFFTQANILQPDDQFWTNLIGNAFHTLHV